MKKIILFILMISSLQGMSQKRFTTAMICHEEDTLSSNIRSAMHYIYGDSTTLSVWNGNLFPTLNKATYGHALTGDEIIENAQLFLAHIAEHDSVFLPCIVHDITYITDEEENKLTQKSIKKVSKFLSSFTQGKSSGKSNTKVKKTTDSFAGFNMKLHSYLFAYDTKNRCWHYAGHAYIYDKKYKLPTKYDKENILRTLCEKYTSKTAKELMQNFVD